VRPDTADGGPPTDVYRDEATATGVATAPQPGPDLPVLDGIRARQHLSVVTVQDRAWIAETDTARHSPARAGRAPIQGQLRPSVDRSAVQ